MSVPPDPAEMKAPVTAYLAAGFSFLFVTLGSWLALTLGLGLAVMQRGGPPWVGAVLGLAILLAAFALGGWSASSTFRMSKRRALEKRLQQMGLAAVTPKWRQGCIAYPVGSCGGLVLGTVTGAIVLWDPRNPSFGLIVGGFLGTLGGFLTTAIVLTVAREYFPLPLALPPVSTCPQCGEPLHSAGSTCGMCGYSDIPAMPQSPAASGPPSTTPPTA